MLVWGYQNLARARKKVVAGFSSSGRACSGPHLPSGVNFSVGASAGIIMHGCVRVDLHE